MHRATRPRLMRRNHGEPRGCQVPRPLQATPARVAACAGHRRGLRRPRRPRAEPALPREPRRHGTRLGHWIGPAVGWRSGHRALGTVVPRRMRACARAKPRTRTDFAGAAERVWRHQPGLVREDSPRLRAVGERLGGHGAVLPAQLAGLAVVCAGGARRRQLCACARCTCAVRVCGVCAWCACVVRVRARVHVCVRLRVRGCNRDRDRSRMIHHGARVLGLTPHISHLVAARRRNA
eukprot:scaffold6116_cov67-Phaeocystis_antarctica.AAC.2